MASTSEDSLAVPAPPSQLNYLVKLWGKSPNGISDFSLQVFLDNVSGCVIQGQTSAHQAAHTKAEEEQLRTSMALRRQQEIAATTLDAEQEVADLQLALTEGELRFVSLRQCVRETDEAIRSVNFRLETFLATHVAPSSAALQLPAITPPAAYASFITDALQPPVMAPLVAYTASETAALQPPAMAPLSAFCYPNICWLAASGPDRPRGLYGLQTCVSGPSRGETRPEPDCYAALGPEPPLCGGCERW